MVFVRGWRAYERGLGRLVAAASSAYRALGIWTFRRPVLMLILTTVFTLGICIGWLRFRIDNSTDLCGFGDLGFPDT